MAVPKIDEQQLAALRAKWMTDSQISERLKNTYWDNSAEYKTFQSYLSWWAKPAYVWKYNADGSLKSPVAQPASVSTTQTTLSTPEKVQTTQMVKPAYEWKYNADGSLKTPTVVPTKMPTPVSAPNRVAQITANLAEWLKKAPEKFSDIETFRNQYDYYTSDADKQKEMDKFWKEKVWKGSWVSFHAPESQAAWFDTDTETTIADIKETTDKDVSWIWTDRIKQIQANVSEWLKANPAVFNDRQMFDRTYNYQEKPPEEKRVLDNIFNAVRSKKILSGIPLDNLDVFKSTVASELLSKNIKVQEQSFETLKSVLTDNMKARLDLYEKRQKDLQSTLDKQLADSQSQINEFQSQIQRQLGWRAKQLQQIISKDGRPALDDASLVALMWEAWVEWASKVIEFKNKIISANNELIKSTQKDIFDLMEKGQITADEAKKSIAALEIQRDTKNAELTTNFYNTIFGIGEEAKKKQTSAIDIVSKVFDNLGLTPEQKSKYFTKFRDITDPTRLVNQIMSDGEIQNAISKNQEISSAAAKQKMQIEMMKAMWSAWAKISPDMISKLQALWITSPTTDTINEMFKLAVSWEKTWTLKDSKVTQEQAAEFMSNVLLWWKVATWDSFSQPDSSSGSTTWATFIATSWMSPRLPDRNNNPWNLKVPSGMKWTDIQWATWVDSQWHVIFATAQDWVNQMAKDVQWKLTGNTRTWLTPNSTLWELWKVYASDPNWWKSVSSFSWYSLSTKLKDIDVKKLLPAIARQEWFTWTITLNQ